MNKKWLLTPFMQRPYVFLFCGLSVALLVMLWIGPGQPRAPAATPDPEPEPALEVPQPQPACVEATDGPLVQFPLSVTSLNLRGAITRVEDLPLLKFALPSIIDSVEPDVARYWIAIAADTGDSWYDSAPAQAAIEGWFAARWEERWPGECAPTLTFHVYPNTRSRNVWAVNYAAQEGYMGGADYFYRINDDTELVAGTNWTSVFVAELQRMRPIPNLGVVCPADPNHKDRKLCTMSFVSTLHLEVFGSLFPFLTKNQYSDDWITNVYKGPYAPIFGKDPHMVSILPHVPIVHKTLPFRYKPGSTKERYEQLVGLDHQELKDFVFQALSS
jgi:hypothetical protein